MSCIGTYVGAPVIRQFGYLIKEKEYVDELVGRARDLQDKKQDIQDRIEAAEREGKQRTHEVTLWIQKFDELRGEATAVQTDCEQRGRCWPNCCSSYKIGKRASKLLIEMIDLENKLAGFDVLVTDAPLTSVQQMCSTSNLVGNKIIVNMEKICGYLISEEETDGVIGIWGMGGVGKTALLKAIYDIFLNNNNGNSVTNELFDHVIFLVVNKDYELENLQKRIIGELGLRSSENFVSQAQIIFQHLKYKNFLLLLDDIWEDVQLKDLGIPYPRSSNERRFRRKVVLTTRSFRVCSGMNCHKKFKVECLEADEAWELFKKNVGEDINLPDIRSHAKEILKKCGGLPIALVVIGRVMATKKSPQEWDYALKQLRNSQHSNIPGMEKGEYYFLRLKFSYDNLQNDKMRKCFLCCSLWPKDFEFEKTDLIMCWMGLGLIDDFDDINEAYNEGYSLIGSLISACLLEPVHEKDDVIKLYNIIRDLALWIARDSGTNINRWLVETGARLVEVPSGPVAEWGEAERVSLMENAIKELPSDLPLCHNLSTLLLQKNWELTAIPGGFFTCKPNLTFLDLRMTGLTKIPKEIRCLPQLRYLNLSDTNISSLPKELGELKNLKYLLLRNIFLQGEVTGIIGRLLELVYLDLFNCGGGFVEADELPPLLKGVGMNIKSEHALQQLSRVMPSILHLCLAIEDMGDSTTTSIHLHNLLSSRIKQSLRTLGFSRCHSIRELVVDVDVGFPRLESLSLYELPNLTEIVWRRSLLPPSECFQRLLRLNISGCNGLKDITWVLHLPCLEKIHLSGCNEMEQLVVIGGGEVTEPTFPRLRELKLYNLPKLAKICDNHADAAVNFPSLEALDVDNCKELKKLPFRSQPLKNANCRRLEIIEGDGDWWKGIEWESDQREHYPLLHRYFKPLAAP